MNWKLQAALIAFLIAVSAALGHATAPSTVTITGNLYDNYGLPVVGARVSEYPLNWSASGSNLIIPHKAVTTTNSSGAFSLTVVGGVLAALVTEPADPSIPNGFLRATLPLTGTVTLAQLLAQKPNIITGFPPGGNLDMGGFTFLNLAPATMAGEPVTYGQGLASGTLFTASGTYSVPTGSTIIDILLLGGSGGGGGGASGATNGGGGGGAGSVEDCGLFAANGAVTVTIGAGGTGGAATANGTDGGNTTASQNSGTTICTAGLGHKGTAGSGGGVGTAGLNGSIADVVGAFWYDRPYLTAGPGHNGTSGAGGAGAGLGQMGGNGGAPSGGSGSNGRAGLVLIRSF